MTVKELIEKLQKCDEHGMGDYQVFTEQKARLAEADHLETWENGFSGQGPSAVTITDGVV